MNSYSPQPSPKIPRRNKKEEDINTKAFQTQINQKLKEARPKLTIDSSVQSDRRKSISTPLSPFEITNAFFFGSETNEGGRGLGKLAISP